jgi:peroxiredoxin
MTLPELTVSQWFNTDKDITLAGLRGKVIVIEAFQMLCPGCVSHGIPLAQKVQQSFPAKTVSVIGLHTVFEHHAAMTPVSLEAFLHEYRITFPVGVDAAGQGAIPKTMDALGMRGTPTMLLIDKMGTLRAHHFGEVSEMRIGAEIATLLNETTPNDNS